MLLEVMLSFIGLMLVCFLVSKVVGPIFRYVLIFTLTCTSDSWVIKSNPSTSAILRAEENGCCIIKQKTKRISPMAHGADHDKFVNLCNKIWVLYTSLISR